MYLEAHKRGLRDHFTVAEQVCNVLITQYKHVHVPHATSYMQLY